jgi:hypothetical protein
MTINFFKKSNLLSLLCLVVGFTANAQVKPLPISIINSSSLARKAELVAIPWFKVLQLYPKLDTSNFKVVNAKGEEISYQLEKLGTAQVKNLLVQVSVGPKAKTSIKLVKGKPAKFEAKTYGRFVPERKDDFAWENDVLAFRMYGKALEGSKDDANGLDIWAKRTQKLVINDWYKTGDYHADHGSGLDFYSVGLTLGAGDIAPYANGKIVYPKHYRGYKILDNGPLRTTFRLTFESFDVAGTAVTMTKTYTVNAGSQLNKVDVVVSKSVPLVIGLVTEKQPGGQKTQLQKEGVSAYWQSPVANAGIIGVAALVKGAFDKIFEGEGQLLNQINAPANKVITYYNGGAWDKAGEITSNEAWLSYLKNFKQKLAQPLTVTYK